MGGFFSAPKAPAPPPPVVVPEPEAPTSAEDEIQNRRDLISRRRRGRSGTIQTSARGLVTPNANAVQKKSLLGE